MGEREVDRKAEADVCRGTTGRTKSMCRQEDEEELQLAAQWERRANREGCRQCRGVWWFLFIALIFIKI